jgi:phosphoglycerate dehydrogenase-like enzyme
MGPSDRTVGIIGAGRLGQGALISGGWLQQVGAPLAGANLIRLRDPN